MEVATVIDFEKLPKRMQSKIAFEPTSGCWLWTGASHPRGYGSVTLLNRTRRAHRAAYEVLVGPVPEGMELDHLCRTPSCVNPDHLEPVTHRVNVLRGVGPWALNKRKTHCLRGHLLDEANTQASLDGFRRCRACQRERHAAYVAANLEVDRARRAARARARRERTSARRVAGVA